MPTFLTGKVRFFHGKTPTDIYKGLQRCRTARAKQTTVFSSFFCFRSKICVRHGIIEMGLRELTCEEGWCMDMTMVLFC